MTGYRLNQYNQIDDYGQDKTWKMQKQAQAFKKRKSQIASTVEVCISLYLKFCCKPLICILIFLWLFEQDALEAADFREYSPRTQESLSCWNPDSIGFNLIEHVLCHIVRKERPGAILVFMTGWDDINSLKDQLQSHPLLGDPSRVLLLACHGSMPSSEQVASLFFNFVPNAYRKTLGGKFIKLSIYVGIIHPSKDMKALV